MNKNRKASDSALGETRSASSRTQLSTWGYEFDISEATWILAKGVRLNVEVLLALVDEEQAPGLRATLAHFAQTHAPATVTSHAATLKGMLKKCGPRISTHALINYRSLLTRRTEYFMHNVRGFLTKWYELGYSGIDDAVMDLLNSWVIPGGIKGDAVKRRDPKEGPLTDVELLAFNTGIAQAYEAGRVDLQSACEALIISHTGRRPFQICQLKVADCDGLDRQSGVERISKIRMPRAKEGGGGFRESFKDAALSPELSDFIRLQCDDVVRKYEMVISQEICDSDRKELPLFPDWSVLSRVDSLDEFRRLASTDRLHKTSGAVRRTLQNATLLAGVVSERTGRLLTVFPRRFRYTVGTRAAREGCGAMVIAEILDHTDTQSVGVYTKTNPEYLTQIDEAVTRELTPIAAAFQGRVVESERDAIRGNDPRSRVRHKGEAMATCGFGGGCAAFVPVPCYTCIHFQPWLDGPHQRVLDQLVNERERVLGESGDVVLASVNDRTIIAVREVIARCLQMRAFLSGAKP